MILKTLNSNQIITLNDFPVHNEQILKIFFRIYQKGCGKIMPPVPVLHKNFVSFSGKLQEIFEEFVARNPQAEYFLLDGSHKTTAAALTGSKISIMIFETDKDVKKAYAMAEVGELFSFILESTIRDIIHDLMKHFSKKSYFQTVQEKTMRMINEKVIPRYMY